MVVKRPTVTAGLLAAFNGLLVLYAALWIAGIPDLRRLTDWRGPVLALVLAIAITALTVIRQIQALEKLPPSF
jgi:hypothetical protein